MNGSFASKTKTDSDGSDGHDGDFEFYSLAAGTYAYIVLEFNLNGYFDDVSDSDAGPYYLTITVSVWCLATVKSRQIMTLRLC